MAGVKHYPDGHPLEIYDDETGQRQTLASYLGAGVVGSVSSHYALTSGDSAAIANTVVETAFNKSLVLPANALPNAGSRITVKAFGFHSTDAVTPTNLRIKVRLGGIGKDLFSRNGAPQLAAANFGWVVVIEAIMRTAGVSGLIQPGYGSYGLVGGNPETISPGGSPFTVNTTIPQTVDVAVIWGVADADNTVILKYLVVELDPIPFGTF